MTRHAPRLLLVIAATISCDSSTEPPPAPSRLAFVTQPGNAEGQVPFDPPVRVALQDGNGNVLADASSDVMVTLAAPTFPAGQMARLSGTTTVRAERGIATFADLSIDLPASGFTLRASTAGLPAVASDPFAVHLTFVEQSAGDFHSCGVTVARFAYCWGLNGQGQLGDSTNGSHHIPTPVKGRMAFRQVSAGGSHTCGITTDGAVYCWGGLPPGTPTSAPPPLWQPTRMQGIPSLDHLSAGHVAQFSQTCGITADNVGYCWGNYDAPVRVSQTLTLRQISTGGAHVCGVTLDNTAYCWGENYRGQLGDGTLDARAAPTPVAGSLRFLRLAAGGEHTCGIATDNVSYCWGANHQGQLGDGTTDSRLQPTPILGNLTFVQLSAGGIYTCGVDSQNHAHCWGGNFAAQLGDGTTTGRLTPTPVAGDLCFGSVSTAVVHSCGLTTDRVLYCWGLDYGGGLLGDGSDGGSRVPRRVAQ